MLNFLILLAGILQLLIPYCPTEDSCKYDYTGGIARVIPDIP